MKRRCTSDDEADASKRFAQSASVEVTDANSGVPFLIEVCHTSATLSSLLSTEVVKTDATSSSFAAARQATQLLKPMAAPAHADLSPFSEQL